MKEFETKAGSLIVAGDRIAINPIDDDLVIGVRTLPPDGGPYDARTCFGEYHLDSWLWDML